MKMKSSVLIVKTNNFSTQTFNELRVPPIIICSKSVTGFMSSDQNYKHPNQTNIDKHIFRLAY